MSPSPREQQFRSNVSQLLIQAQDAERSRIARELHDNINQQLSVLAWLLDDLTDNLPASRVEIQQRLTRAKEKVAQLSEDIHDLSHRLHSSRLDPLGLRVATEGFVREIRERSGVEID